MITFACRSACFKYYLTVFDLTPSALPSVSLQPAFQCKTESISSRYSCIWTGGGTHFSFKAVLSGQYIRSIML